MKTLGQLWVLRRFKKIIPILEDVINYLNPKLYTNYKSYEYDVFDETISILNNGDDNFDSNTFNDKYSSVISTMEDIFGNQIKNHFTSELSDEKESINEASNNMEKLVKHWERQIEKGKKIRFDHDDLEFWGIVKRPDKFWAQRSFQELVGGEEFAKKFIKSLISKTFSTKDFEDKSGGYNFEWYIDHITYQDFDFKLYGKALTGGSVNLIDGRHLSLNEALEDDEIGYEIQEEVNSVVEDCMNEIITPVTGENVTVQLILIPEE